MKDAPHGIIRLDNARYQGGRRTSPVLGIILHCTAGDTVEGATSWLNRFLKNGEGKASYHYLIAKSGRITRTLDPGMVAYHAGRSRWPGLPDSNGSLNHCTVGIGWANDNGSDADLCDDDLTPEQIGAGLWLCEAMMSRYGVPPNYVLGHREVSPGRKSDPLPRILDLPAWRARLARRFPTLEELAQR